MLRILAIDGGGVRGIFPAYVEQFHFPGKRDRAPAAG